MKKYLILVLIVLLIGALFVVVMAGGPSNPAGKSNTGLLYLYEKNTTTWEIIEGGAWGKMKYNLSGEEFEFVFNGHGLEAGWDYTLIYFPDPWGLEAKICLGTATADEYGDVHIMNSVDTGDLPIEADENAGAKIWLVLSGDVDCDEYKMTGWTPTEYLFEEDGGLTFDDTDDE